jgi:thioredoxin-related protein
MKKILLSLLLLASIAMSADIKWNKEYSVALKTAQQQKKPLLFIISNHNCRYCVQLETTTLKDPKVAQKLNGGFVASLVYMDESPSFPRDLYVGGTPAIWFIGANGEPMFEPLMGAVDNATMLKALDIVATEYKKVPAKK